MPTGYTAELCEHAVPFERFVLTCARAMGALVLMRDAAMDAPIPETIPPSDYHLRERNRIEAELARVSRLTRTEAEAEATEAYEKAKASWSTARAHTELVRARLIEMRERVLAWAPPSEDHEEFKRFMLEQLQTTIDHDGSMAYYHEPKPTTGPAWKAQQIKRLEESFTYHATEHAKEVARAEGRTRWIRELRESLR